jgi:nucleoside-diphosphate-sugar epimerase
MQFKKQAEETGTVQLFDISAQRDFVHVSQVVNTHVKFFGVPVSGTFNVGTGTTKSFAQVAALYTDNVQIIPMPENLKHSYQMYTCANMTKTNNVLTN